MRGRGKQSKYWGTGNIKKLFLFGRTMETSQFISGEQVNMYPLGGPQHNNLKDNSHNVL